MPKMTDAVWAEIERSESFLVCSMYEEAAALASSIIKQRGHPNLSIDDDFDFDLYEAMQSAGMVFVQSLKRLSRTSTILNELKTLFFNIEAIPVQVLLTGACFQISEASTLGAREFLEEFLNKWRYGDEQYYVLASAEINLNFREGSHFVLGVDKYIEVVELYAVILLATVSSDVDLAISWVEQAALPEKKRQELLRRLHSLFSIKGPNVPVGAPKGSKTSCPLNGENNLKQAILKLYREPYGCLWWFRNTTLRFSNYQMVISNGKMLIGCMILFIYYIFRRKEVSLQRIIRRQALFVKKSLVDLWQLAFSYQVNLLAAIQSLPAAT
ncbi:hypothetical protein CRYUN_Cryun17cG0000600 [Craigia yunnanensis]